MRIRLASCIAFLLPEPSIGSSHHGWGWAPPRLRLATPPAAPILAFWCETAALLLLALCCLAVDPWPGARYDRGSRPTSMHHPVKRAGDSDNSGSGNSGSTSHSPTPSLADLQGRSTPQRQAVPPAPDRLIHRPERSTVPPPADGKA